MNTTPRSFTTGIALLLIGLSFIGAVNLTVPRSARAAGVRYAAPTAQGSGDCSSWANACTLQTALAQAVSGDEIWVKAGAHYPGAAGDRAATFTLKNGVALYGGFAGTETDREQRNWQANRTILSGDIDQNDVNTDGNWIAETWNDLQGNNAYHVVTGSGTDVTAVLDGFIITAGQANDSNEPDYRGGGVYNAGGSPTIANVTFSGNSAEGIGGGMYNNGGAPTLTNVTFSGNSAEGSGGGMYNINSSPTLTNVTFGGNSASSGGGMYNDWGAPTLTNVTFSGNQATYGGGMYNINSSPTLTNVTFGGNSAGAYGGGMYNWQGAPTLANVIIWGNNASSGRNIYNYESTPTIAYSDIQYCGGSDWNPTCGTDGGGNIDADPRFVNPTGGNLRLQLVQHLADAAIHPNL